MGNATGSDVPSSCPRILRSQLPPEHLPEDEYEQYEQGEEDGHIVDGAQHDHQLSPQCGHEPYQLEYAQQAKRSEHGQSTVPMALVGGGQLEQAQQHNGPVECIEATLDVLVEAEGAQLEHHLQAEDGREDDIAHLHRTGQTLRLIVVLNAHGEGVEQNGQEDELMEVVVVDGDLQGVTCGYPGTARPLGALVGQAQLATTATGQVVGGRQCVVRVTTGRAQ